MPEGLRTERGRQCPGLCLAMRVTCGRAGLVPNQATTEPEGIEIGVGRREQDPEIPVGECKSGFMPARRLAMRSRFVVLVALAIGFSGLAPRETLGSEQQDPDETVAGGIRAGSDQVITPASQRDATERTEISSDADNAALKSLSVTTTTVMALVFGGEPAGDVTLSPAFEAGTSHYEATVPFGVTGPTSTTRVSGRSSSWSPSGAETSKAHRWP